MIPHTRVQKSNCRYVYINCLIAHKNVAYCSYIIVIWLLVANEIHVLYMMHWIPPLKSTHIRLSKIVFWLFC
jgi:hypothetical protein